MCAARGQHCSGRSRAGRRICGQARVEAQPRRPGPAAPHALADGALADDDVCSHRTRGPAGTEHRAQSDHGKTLYKRNRGCFVRPQVYLLSFLGSRSRSLAVSLLLSPPLANLWRGGGLGAVAAGPGLVLALCAMGTLLGLGLVAGGLATGELAARGLAAGRLAAGGLAVRLGLLLGLRLGLRPEFIWLLPALLPAGLAMALGVGLQLGLPPGLPRGLPLLLPLRLAALGAATSSPAWAPVAPGSPSLPNPSSSPATKTTTNRN